MRCWGQKVKSCFQMWSLLTSLVLWLSWSQSQHFSLCSRRIIAYGYLKPNIRIDKVALLNSCTHLHQKPCDEEGSATLNHVFWSLEPYSARKGWTLRQRTLGVSPSVLLPRQRNPSHLFCTPQDLYVSAVLCGTTSGLQQWEQGSLLIWFCRARVMESCRLGNKLD